MCAERMGTTERRGFTLVELLVIIVILGLLVALVGPRFLPGFGKGKQATIKTQIGILGQALERFRSDTGRYPTTQEGLSALVTNPGVENWKGPYLKEVLPPDPWGRPYDYRCPGSQGEYDIFSYGRDGSPGGRGENKDVSNRE